MEHRCTLRKPLVLDVVITYHALGLVHGRTLNVGTGGMFVTTGCIELPVNALVKTSFYIDDNGIQRPCSTEAMVMHNRAGGIGLMFNDLDEDLYSALRRLVFSRSEEGEKRVYKKR